jgi:hypothetical protein
MATKHKVTVSVQPATYRLGNAERRAAQIAALSSKQAELKQEAAERRAKRAAEPAPSAPRKVRRSSAR